MFTVDTVECAYSSDTMRTAERNISTESEISPPSHKITSPTSKKDDNDNDNDLNLSSRSAGSSSSRRGWSSGGSTPKDLDMSTHSMPGNPKTMMHSSSVLGLDKMIEAKAEQGLSTNIVHMEVPFGKPIEDVYDGVHNGPVLGSGISGLVRLCTHKATGATYAVKCLDLGLIETDEGLHQLREEIAIMCQLDHPNIVRLEEVYESHSEIYLVQELCVGGELFDRLDDQPDYHYSEAQCARLVKQMLCSVRYIHSKGIIHRDLKLENFLFSTTKPDSELKMIDFGLSKHFKYGEVHHEAVGTPYTVAPEVIRGEYDERCDVWAIGVITYLLLSGDPPFGGCGGPESLLQVRSNILQGRFEFEPPEVWANVSQEAKDFIRMLLVTDPNHRPTGKQCQKSPWLNIWAKKEKLESDTRLDANVVKALVNFKEYSDMRKLLCEVLSFTLMPDQITDLRKEFEKLDTDGSGEISLNGLKKVLMQEAGAGSLGALGEEEVEDIFNAMRVRKTETQIHWHEFIAAGLSQCKVDERNLKLAFDRLDSNHKGYITFENVMDLMGRDGAESEDKMKEMWSESMQACNCHTARITYDDFLLLMKGQTRIPEKTHINPVVHQSMPNSLNHGGDLDILYECTSISESTGSDDDVNNIFKASRRQSEIASVTTLDPLLPAECEDDIEDVPLSMDDEDDFDQKISDSADLAMAIKQEQNTTTAITTTTPSQSPVCPPSPGNTMLLQAVGMPSPLSSFRRSRSKSVDDKDLENESTSEEHARFITDIRRALPLPEHTHDAKEIEKVIHDETLTPLVVNRQLYRAHRKMRHAVLEASKRFEDQQVERTKAELRAKQQAESSSRYGAGLVMRRGHKKEVSSDTIRKLMMQKQKEHDSVVSNAARKSGRTRSRRGRKKTVSDMSEMMNAINSAEAQPNVTVAASLKVVDDEPPSELLLHDITKPEPTVPGVFRKTIDPFESMGSMIGMIGRSNTMSESHIDSSTGVEYLKPIQSSLKLSLSDGELNTKDTPIEDSPSITQKNDATSLSGLPPPPLDI
jgi:calcium-dependent protein kinase